MLQLHEGSFGECGIILVSINRTYSLDIELTFRVVGHPKVGQVRIVQDIGDSADLLHLAQDSEAAELWLSKSAHTRTRLEHITADVAEARTAL